MIPSLLSLIFISMEIYKIIDLMGDIISYNQLISSEFMSLFTLMAILSFPTFILFAYWLIAFIWTQIVPQALMDNRFQEGLKKSSYLLAKAVGASCLSVFLQSWI